MSTELTPAKITLAGTTQTGVTVDDSGNWFTNNGRCFIHVLGGTAGTFKLTVDSPSLCSYGETHDVEVTPASGVVKLIGPLPKSRFDDADGKVQITFAAGAAADLMKIQILELP